MRYLSQPLIQRIPNVLQDIHSGEIRIPRFQRPFVWTPEQRILLVRSIYEGLPIGSILIWRTRDHDLASYDRIGPLRLAWSSEEKKDDIRQYVLDGHQRLTTLYVALGRGLPASETSVESMGPDEDPEEAGWTIFFDLEEKAFKPRPRHDEPPPTWLPLYILLDPSQLYEFQKQLLRHGLDKAFVNRAESLASAFKDYSIPVAPIVTEDLELATQSLQRVNSSGTKMTEVHMVSALTWSPEFDLNERMTEILTELGEVGWEDLEEKMILNTCKAALDLDIYYAATEEIRKSIKDRPQVLQEATESLKGAAHFLRDRCKVYGPTVLPYSFQIVLLADAIWRATDGLQQKMGLEAENAVVKWFWLTTYTEHFAGISAVRLARTLEHLREVAISGCNPEPPGMSKEVTSAPRRFDFRAARSRAIALRLAELSSQTGSSEPYDPFKLLADHGRDAMPMLIPSREVASRQAEGPENRVLVHPKEASSLWRSLREPLLFEQNASLLRSHAIGEAAAQALRLGDLHNFLKFRRDSMVSIERSFVERLGLEYTGD